jgi:hypothetical protein
MSSNQRNRGNRGNNQGGNNQGNGNGGNRQPKQPEVKDFWGESVAPLPQIDAPSGASDPSAMVRSLGKPPLPGNDNAAEHYFAVVYERAAVLAGALSAALLE